MFQQLFHSKDRAQTGRRRTPVDSRVVGILSPAAAVALFLCLSLTATLQAQEPSGTAAAGRLQAERPNTYRGAEGVQSFDAVKENMRKLFQKILIEGEGDGKADKWYSPHLRDISGSQQNRDKEAREVRGQTAPFPFMIWYCSQDWLPQIEAACPLTVENIWSSGTTCKWHTPIVPDGPLSHRPTLSCFTRRATTPYKQRNKTSNFKMCCVREGEDETATSEWIASKYPDGDGWAGLFEYYYPTAALGWENDRTTTMIVDKDKVKQCREGGGGKEGSNALMESDKAQEWVKKAIERNLKAVGGDSADMNKVSETIRDSIKEVRPKDEKLRFADSLKGEGLTLRLNFAALEPDQRVKTAKRFCMHPAQFDKLFDPSQDLLAHQGTNPGDLNSVPVWSNYCPEGVKLMTDPDESARLRNVDGTPTKLDVGTKVWMSDQMFCQRMNAATNPNLLMTGLAPQGSSGLTPESVGYTCLNEGGKLNGSMVPVELYRHAAVERRTAITDHALGFLIAGGIAPGMIEGNRSYYKRFEPQPYSQSSMFWFYKTFVGTRFQGGDRNELGQVCPPLSGENLQFQNKSDRLYISDVTNQAFDQNIVEHGDGKGGVDRYRQEWGKDPETGQKIGARGLDEYSQNYAAPFRIFATCPAGFKRWRPNILAPFDPHNFNLRANIELFCREENFGGVPY